MEGNNTMDRYIYFRKNGGMRFWRILDIGGSVYVSPVKDENAERVRDNLLLGLYLLNALLLVVIAAQKYSAM